MKQNRAAPLKCFVVFLICSVVCLITWIMTAGDLTANYNRNRVHGQTRHEPDMVTQGDSEVEVHGTHLKRIIPRLKSRVILSAANSGYRELAENFVTSIKKLYFPDISLVLVCEDEAVYDYFKQRQGIFVVKTQFETNITEAQPLRSKLFERIVNRRVEYVLELLHNGIEVLYSDVDTVFVQDPFPYLTGDFDLFVLDEYEIPHCPGFFFVKPSKDAIDMMTSWKKFIPGEKQNQIAYNKAIMLTEELKFTRINRLLFIVSRFYSRKNSPWYERVPKPLIVHLNGERGTGRKITKMKQTGLWFV